MCGGSHSGPIPAAAAAGLSPRVRGKLSEDAADGGPEGSIPACAGEAVESSGGHRNGWVYPRVCGGSRRKARSGAASGGLSPRVRGKRFASCTSRLAQGSIPACAGEAGGRYAGREKAVVYPRVCGGSLLLAAANAASDGLSPRVRGKRPRPRQQRPPRRSIPACAGEAGSGRGAEVCYRVYPRVCGGSLPGTGGGGGRAGLSPRVRGKRRPPPACRRWRRSIPACAGEAEFYGTGLVVKKVYPRVCGGSPPQAAEHALKDGLSPRVRGKPYLMEDYDGN